MTDNCCIDDGSFAENPVLIEFMHDLREAGRALHLFGLLSDGGVHSHRRHLSALLAMAARHGPPAVYVHAFTDGRDTSPTDGIHFVRELQDELARLGTGRIATLVGRYYAMDRDGRWDRLERAYQAFVHGVGHRATDPVQAVEASYQANVTDEFLLPTVIEQDGAPVGLVREGDGILPFNFRADRLLQFLRMFTEEGFPHFKRLDQTVRVLTLVPFGERFSFPVAFPSGPLPDVLGQVVAEAGLPQFRVAETEKYTHLTWFLNGRREAPFPGEERFLVPSPKVRTYDLEPEMSAFAIGDILMERVQMARYPLIIANFANGDLVGHTGDLEAAVQAVSTIDRVLSKVIPVAYNAGYDCLITADHGNIEKMVRLETGEPCHTHTANPVPCCLLARGALDLASDGSLADVAPTVLELLNLPCPAAMTGQSLLVRRK
ncbi:MAG: 2,3-bisphosphoglycerate-independent phosphoglycerate mutase [Candidatus Ozemobacter sibiricus]|uniref:2,3-bisphosphoglycerate-independent phosphoglycerate mutase n=1 Tax=Candidatus Ozemobacter sibiricus TaxID=2268124 RepID=A0A367ZQX0_9BACT|nr:MAG: 2,3-bisphosphoglycerate-independent phosphoglycerate mutase [Candidatus Ozemobacter sibiricus]